MGKPELKHFTQIDLPNQEEGPVLGPQTKEEAFHDLLNNIRTDELKFNRPHLAAKFEGLDLQESYEKLDLLLHWLEDVDTWNPGAPNWEHHDRWNRRDELMQIYGARDYEQLKREIQREITQNLKQQYPEILQGVNDQKILDSHRLIYLMITRTLQYSQERSEENALDSQPQLERVSA